jgi:L-threonylcarbamoyladenylate synthase
VQTKVTNDAEEAAGFIKNGGIVAFPTETVYGLGAAVFDERALARIFEAKRRPADNPLIAHIAGLEQIPLLAAEITLTAQRLIDEFFPGPLTIVMNKTAAVPVIATAGLDTIGIRMPRYPLAHEFLMACGTPVAAPSANLSGKPSPTTWQAVAEDLDGRIDCILQGDATEIGLESTVVDCTSEVPIVLRSGSVSLEQLVAVVPSTRQAEKGELNEIRSPGMKHQHYSPHARVVIVDEGQQFEAGPNSAYIGITRPPIRLERELICSDVDSYAHSLFEFFRECDRNGITTIYCESVEQQGIGAALMDRIRRAAMTS